MISQRGPEIIVPSDRWVAEVNYRGKTGIYELSKKILSAMNFEDRVVYTKNARARGDFSPYDSIFNYLFFASVADPNIKNKDKIIKYLRSNLRNRFLATTSLAEYNYDRNGNDRFVHDAKLDSQYESKAQIVGSDREINEEDSGFLEAMFGESDHVKVMESINGTPIYIFRLNSRPPKKEVIVARFYAFGSRLYLDCSGDSTGRFSSFGYKLVEKEK